MRKASLVLSSLSPAGTASAGSWSHPAHPGELSKARSRKFSQAIKALRRSNGTANICSRDWAWGWPLMDNFRINSFGFVVLFILFFFFFFPIRSLLFVD